MAAMRSGNSLADMICAAITVMPLTVDQIVKETGGSPSHIRKILSNAQSFGAVTPSMDPKSGLKRYGLSGLR